MRTFQAGVLVLLAAALMAGTAVPKGGHAREDKEKVETKTGAITGIVIDIPCYLMKHGHGHSVCALDQGLPVGLVDGNGHIWVAITDKYAAANKLLAPLMGRKVKASGWYAETKDLSLIAIAKVEAVEHD